MYNPMLDTQLVRLVYQDRLDDTEQARRAWRPSAPTADQKSQGTFKNLNNVLALFGRKSKTPNPSA